MCQPAAVQSFSKGHLHVSYCRPTFDVILAKLLVMRQSLGSAPTPPLQRYELQSKAAAAKEAAVQLKQDNKANTAEVRKGGVTCFFYNGLLRCAHLTACGGIAICTMGLEVWCAKQEATDSVHCLGQCILAVSPAVQIIASAQAKVLVC